MDYEYSMQQRTCTSLVYFDTAQCPHCEDPSQTIEHLFRLCPETRRTYAGLNRQGTNSINQNRWLQGLQEDNDASFAYKLKVMHVIYTNNIMKMKIDANAINPMVASYIATAKAVAEDRDRLEQFLRIWY